MDVYRTLIDLAVPGVYCVVNNAAKKVFISYTNNILLSLSRNITEVAAGGFLGREEGWEFIILETEKDDGRRRMLYEHYCSLYRDRGFEIARYSKAIAFKPVIVTGKVAGLGITIKAVVRLSKELIVGVFDSIAEAREWMARAYPDGKEVLQPIFASTDATMKYIKSNNIDINRWKI